VEVRNGCLEREERSIGAVDCRGRAVVKKKKEKGGDLSTVNPDKEGKD